MNEPPGPSYKIHIFRANKEIAHSLVTSVNQSAVSGGMVISLYRDIIVSNHMLSNYVLN